MLTVRGESGVGGIPRLDLVIDVKKIKGMAHLIAIDDKNWIINNRIDLTTWNELFMED